jgi:hypothetical protein
MRGEIFIFYLIIFLFNLFITFKTITSALQLIGQSQLAAALQVGWKHANANCTTQPTSYATAAAAATANGRNASTAKQRFNAAPGIAHATRQFTVIGKYFARESFFSSFFGTCL